MKSEVEIECKRLRDALVSEIKDHVATKQREMLLQRGILPQDVAKHATPKSFRRKDGWFTVLLKWLARIPSWLFSGQSHRSIYDGPYAPD